MIRQSLSVLFLAAAVTGCAHTPPNPVDYVTYREEPLVKQVEKGMTMQQVLAIGGTPSKTIDLSTTGGACNNYILNRDGHQQPYYVSFDSTGHVDSKGFMTCEQHQSNQRASL